MCLDQNAWKFFQVLWSEKNPIKPSRRYPTAPGMVWMLAGMGLGEGMVKIGASGEAEVAVAKSGKKITRISPATGRVRPFAACLTRSLHCTIILQCLGRKRPRPAVKPISDFAELVARIAWR